MAVKVRGSIFVLSIAVCCILLLSDMGSKPEVPVTNAETATVQLPERCPHARFCKVEGCFAGGTEAVLDSSGRLVYYCRIHWMQAIGAPCPSKAPQDFEKPAKST